MIILILSTFSCSDYLDVVPKGSPTVDDIFKTENQAQKYVVSMYNAIPNRWHAQNMPDAFAGGDMITGWYGSVRWFGWKSLVYNLESASSTYFAMWSTTATYPTGYVSYDIFSSLRTCYDVLDNLDKVPDIKPENLKRWKGEAYFMIAYYHQTLLEYYGPTVLIKESIPLDATGDRIFLKRRPYDECVDFISEMYDKASDLLPSRWAADDYGRATAAAALGQKARLYLYAASPLVNGNSEFYSGFKNKDGEVLMPQTYDKNKWKKAMDAAATAIQYCESNGYKLYESALMASKSDFDRGKHNYHACFVGEPNAGSSWNLDEYLFSMNGQGTIEYNIKNMAPRVGFTKYSSEGFRGYIIPTWDCVHLYYTKNGLPLDVDPLTRNLNLYSVASGDSTALLNRNREPRFYASIGFDRGRYIVNGDTIVIKSRRGEPQQNDGNTSNEYQSDNGYYCQKWISKTDSYNTTTKKFTYNKYVYPYLRMAELYLSYAEADFEYNGTLSAKSLEYLNKVRRRAGLPKFEDSWAMVGGIPSGNNLRTILHQERTIEFLLEGRRFHDIRRWKIAQDEMLRPQKAWNLAGTTQNDFYQVKNMKEGGTRVFESPKTYWLAIPLDQINTNYNLVQNPGY